MIRYFGNFPLISYGGVDMRNLVLRAGVARSIVDKYGVFYPYRVLDEDRPDTIAFDYYGDSDFAWLVLASNDMVDPYHDWPLCEADFMPYIESKYGSYEASTTVHHYESPNSSRWMTPTTRENLPPEDRIGFDVEVTHFDWERAMNEEKKKIRLLSRSYSRRAALEIEGALAGGRRE